MLVEGKEFIIINIMLPPLQARVALCCEDTNISIKQLNKWIMGKEYAERL